MKLPGHQTWIFDCDGVLLQSNDVKSRFESRDARVVATLEDVTVAEGPA